MDELQDKINSLSQVIKLENEILFLGEQINKLYLFTISPKITDLTKVKVQTSIDQPDGNANIICKLVDLQKERDNKIIEYIAIQKNAMIMINKLDDYNEKQTLYNMFIKGYNRKKTAEQMHYSERRIGDFYNQAIRKV